MSKPLTPRRLREITSFANCNCPVSQPNMEKARTMLQELIGGLEQSVSLNLRLLPVEEYKKRHDPIEADTVAATIKHQQEIAEAMKVREIV